MGKLLCMKNHVIGQGKPLVCVPVMNPDRDGIIREVKELAGTVDMIEWRVDAFEKVQSLKDVRNVLTDLAPLVENTILVFTFRSKRQGGTVQLDEEQIYALRQAAAESKVADLIDLEYFEAKNPQKEIALLQSMGAHVIASHHDFEQTPERNVLWMLLEQMHESGADLVKLAVMPQSMEDVLSLLIETNHFHDLYPDRALITMSMGKKGCISRVAGEFFGSCVTFGAGSEASAPGQLPVEELEKVLEILHSRI